ncbi:MAG: YbdD/YjiX family protein [Gammaproteobacteria bacterium]|nr:YbdD/YjiX family protein [Gammaproteobacteria bacterium]
MSSNLYSLCDVVTRFPALAWRFLRRLSGDDAYERYREHLVRTHPLEQPLSRPEFEHCRQEWKWRQPSRCC